MFGNKKAIAFHLLKSCLLDPSFTMEDDVLEELEPIQSKYSWHPHGLVTFLCHHANLQPCAVPGSCPEHGYSLGMACGALQRLCLDPEKKEF